jgi:hypothetical protein
VKSFGSPHWRAYTTLYGVTSQNTGITTPIAVKSYLAERKLEVTNKIKHLQERTTTTKTNV